MISKTHKILLYSCLYIFSASRPAQAQQCKNDRLTGSNPDAVVTLHVGLRAAMGGSTFHGDDADTPSLESTLQFKSLSAVGLSSGIVLSRDLFGWRGGLQLDISRTTKGSGLSVDGEEVATIELQYYDIALLAQVERVLHGRLDGYLLSGPRLAILRDATHLSSGGELDVTTATHDRDWGMVLGAGVAWSFRPSHRFTLDARADVGFTTIDATANDEDRRNLAVSLSLGYQWSYPPRVAKAAPCPDS